MAVITTARARSTSACTNRYPMILRRPAKGLRVYATLVNHRFCPDWLAEVDIEMTRDEQLAYFARRDAAIEQLQDSLDQMLAKIQAIANSGTGGDENVSVPLTEIKEFKSILDSIAGLSSYHFSYWSPGLLGSHSGHMSVLKVPLNELREFAELLDSITGSPGISLNSSLSTYSRGSGPGHVSRLHVPLSELKEYEVVLDRVIAPRRQLDASS